MHCANVDILPFGFATNRSIVVIGAAGEAAAATAASADLSFCVFSNAQFSFNLLRRCGIDIAFTFI